MRQVGSISKMNLAERFADYLRAGGIDCTVDSGTEGYRVWVRDDDRVAAAKDELPAFLAEPDHQRYLDAEKLVKVRVREDLNRQLAARRNIVDVTENWDRPVIQTCPLTIVLIAISVVAAFFLGLDPRHIDPRTVWFLFSDDGTLQPILHGEVWRIFTPIFLHADMMHLAFNMIAMWQLGTLIEFRLGTLKVLGIVLVIAALSNFFQFYFAGQWFRGMSGVVYGLFGYIWIRGRLEPGSGFDLPQQTVTMAMVWFVLCLVGVVSNIANWAHGIGLLTGIALAAGGSFLKTLIRRK